MNDARASRRRAAIDDAFRAFVGDSNYPCLAGKGVVRERAYGLGVYGVLGTARATSALANDLANFLARPAAERTGFTAYTAVFTQRGVTSERTFEERLWTQLQLLNEQDSPAAGWDPAVTSDPDDPHFSFSFAGSALFVIGLHPRSSRLARRFRWPTLVFNPHAQFEQLRAQGQFERLRGAIRARELALQGNLNPSLADFGTRSEARQYSGRDTEDEWRCPFHAAPAPNDSGSE